jgi:hypothetical protein
MDMGNNELYMKVETVCTVARGDLHRAVIFEWGGTKTIHCLFELYRYQW